MTNRHQGPSTHGPASGQATEPGGQETQRPLPATTHQE